MGASGYAERTASPAPSRRVSQPVAAIIRLCYFEGEDDLYRRRLDFFLAEVLPRLRAQTVPTDVWVWVHPRHHRELFLRRIPGIRQFMVNLRSPSIAFEETKIRGYPWNAVIGLPRYRDQVLMGSDDLISPTFVERSLDALRGVEDVPVIVTHHPAMVDMRTGKCYEMHRWPRPSPFMLLRQNPTSSRYTWVWAYAHNRFQRYVPRIIYLEPGEAFMGINDDNDGTRVDPTMPEIARPPWL